MAVVAVVARGWRWAAVAVAAPGAGAGAVVVGVAVAAYIAEHESEHAERQRHRECREVHRLVDAGLDGGVHVGKVDHLPRRRGERRFG